MCLCMDGVGVSEAVGATDCGLRWRDQQFREELAAAADGGAAQEAAAAAALMAAAAPPPVAPSPQVPDRRPKAPWQCQRCARTVTPCHRPGPDGKGTLCNGMFAKGDVGEGGIGVWGSCFGELLGVLARSQASSCQSPLQDVR